MWDGRVRFLCVEGCEEKARFWDRTLGAPVFLLSTQYGMYGLLRAHLTSLRRNDSVWSYARPFLKHATIVSAKLNVSHVSL